MLSPLKLPLMLHRAFSLVKFAGQTAHCITRGPSSSGSPQPILRCISFWGLGAGMLNPLKVPLMLHRAFSLVKFAGQNAHCHFQEVQLKWLSRAYLEVPLFLGAGGRHAQSFEAPSDASQSILPCQVCWSNCTLPFPGDSAQVALQSLS